MTDARPHTRRALMATGGLSLALLAVGRHGLAMAQDGATPTDGDMTGMPEMDEGRAALKDRLDDFTHIWRATSPATHSGDVYTLTVTNTSDAEQPLLVVTTLMDHGEHYNAPVVVEELSLPAGGPTELVATNTYGVANHFQTTVLANTGLVTDFELLVVVVNSTGVETARFTQDAFMILSIEEMRASSKERRRMRRQEEEVHQTDAQGTPTP